MAKEAPKYDYARKRQAVFKAVIRAAMTLYLTYLAFQLFRDLFSGTPSMPVPFILLAGTAFLVIAIAIGIYAFRHYRTDLKDAELTSTELARLEQEQQQEEERREDEEDDLY